MAHTPERIIYFTAGEQSTAGEQTHIDKLVHLVAPKYELSVMRGDQGDASMSFGSGKDHADYVAGAVPSPLYDGIPVINPDELPATVVDGSIVTVTNSVNADGHPATAYTAGETLDHVQLASTVAMVDNGEQFDGSVVTGTGNNASIVVVGGVITAILLS